MIAKRFTLAYADYDWWAICDKENPTELGISGEDVVELLNELYEENGQLKLEYKVLHTQYQDLKKFVENSIDEVFKLVKGKGYSYYHDDKKNM